MLCRTYMHDHTSTKDNVLISCLTFIFYVDNTIKNKDFIKELSKLIEI